MKGTKLIDVVQCGFTRKWPLERFDVGDINVIISPGDQPRTFKSELRRARQTGKAGILDPNRIDVSCYYIV